ncbi:hypothetical protein H4R33_003902 [Dimargaris cristalligena]|nr:hypothetical protein H4R33_003902 [Dimargaris cristalligena]
MPSDMSDNGHWRDLTSDPIHSEPNSVQAALTQMCASIDRVAKMALYRLVQYMLASDLTLVVSGNISPVKHKLPGVFASYRLKCQQS